jgi:hypothetical protein
MLSLQTMLLIRERIRPAIMLAYPSRSPTDTLSMLLVLLQLLGVHCVQCLQSLFEVRNESVAARAREVFAHDNAHHFHFLGVWGHGVGGYDPAAFAELVGTGDVVFSLGGEDGEEGEKGMGGSLHGKFIVLFA